MASSSGTAATGGDSNSNDDSDNRNELIIAIVALAISVMAMIIAVLQALQQYFGSAQGYSLCSDRTIGDWAVFTKRKLRLRQFRFEVRFRVPVIFVASPGNVYGPLGDDDEKEIVYLDGTAANYKRTHTWTPEEFDLRRKAKLKGADTRETIHTADNELTTWLALLMAIQRMERESREWQRRISGAYQIPVAEHDRHTLAVGIQEKARSWDTNPDGMKKPYATTAMCHLVEMMAMLGIYWREFDRSKNMYRAQGNGFSMTGAMVPNLGITFTFEKVGKTWFQENRIVPRDSVKQLCFGFCPTIFQAGLHTPLYTDEPKDEGTLQLGTPAEVAETLVSFGCNTNTVNYFRLGNEHTRYSHLFPVPFEMLGMVGDVLQIHHTTFTMLPNPTYFTWNKSAFSLASLLAAFGSSLDDAVVDGTGPVQLRDPNSHLSRLRRDLDRVVAVATEDAKQKRIEDISVAAARKVAEAKKIADQRNHAIRKRNSPRIQRTPSLLERVKAVGAAGTARARKLLARVRKLLVRMKLVSDPVTNALLNHPRDLVPHVKPRPSFPLYLDTLHHAIKRCDLFLADNYDLVQYVFALHMQELLYYLNSRPYSTDDEAHGAADGADSGAGLSPAAAAAAAAGDVAASSTSRRRQKKRDNNRQGLGFSPPDSAEYYNGQYIPLHIIDTASWAERHRLLMRLYVTFIRARVTAAPIPDNLAVYKETAANKPKIARQDSSTLSALAAQEADEGGSQKSGVDGIELGAVAASEQYVEEVTAIAAAAFAQGAGRAVPDAAPGIAPSADPGAGPSTARSSAGSSTTATTATAVPVAGPAAAAILPGLSATRFARASSPFTAQATSGSTTGANAYVAAIDATRARKMENIQRPTEARDIDAIWCTLTFRMICWLMLHDFHKKDVQIGKSDVYDSRQAVYLL